VGLLIRAWSDKEFELSEGSALHTVDIWSAAYGEKMFVPYPTLLGNGLFLAEHRGSNQREIQTKQLSAALSTE
jgi:hypothetical protein